MKDRKEITREIGSDNRRRNPFESLESQIKAEYNLAWKHQKPEKDEAELRLKLYNNQKRDKKAVGDTTMFSIFQTVLASLYEDRLQVDFVAKEQGDIEVADNLTILAESDYSEMEKDVTDFEWDWDTCFFGRGLVDMQEYVRDPEKNIFLPMPHVLDPITFLRDPYCNSINGDAMRRGAARFYGYEVKMTKAEMLDNAHIFEDIDFTELQYGSGTQSILKDAVQARADAQGFQADQVNAKEKELGANAQYDITIWNTHYANKKTGKVEKIKIWAANDRSKVIGIQILKTLYWPVVDRPLYPHSHDWRGTSIPDLTEDKQRARAIAQNLGLRAMTADLYPSYIYNTNKISNRKDLKVGFNKFIPVDGKDGGIADAVMPLIKARPNMQLLDFIYNSLDISAQKATATPDIQQGIQSEKDRPLGETNILASRVDTRYSLAAKVFGWSEKRFWKQWYNSYQENFKEDIDEKVLRIVGAFGPKWRPIMKKDITPQRFDPDIKIESRNVNRATEAQEKRDLTIYFGQAFNEPTANRKWALKRLGRLNGLKKDEIDRLFPPTVDERLALKENDLLNEDKITPVAAEDDHLTHLEVHALANPTNATMAHIATHEKALSIKKLKPELFPPDPTMVDPNAPQGQQQGNATIPSVQPQLQPGSVIPTN